MGGCVLLLYVWFPALSRQTQTSSCRRNDGGARWSWMKRKLSSRFQWNQQWCAPLSLFVLWLSLDVEMTRQEAVFVVVGSLVFDPSLSHSQMVRMNGSTINTSNTQTDRIVCVTCSEMTDGVLCINSQQRWDDEGHKSRCPSSLCVRRLCWRWTDGWREEKWKKMNQNKGKEGRDGGGVVSWTGISSPSPTVMKCVCSVCRYLFESWMLLLDS